MREILFRGKRTDNGEWVEGYYMKHINRTPCVIDDSVEEKDVEHIIFYDAFSDWNMPRGIAGTYIDPATLGQYTGLRDKTGKGIFDGDIVRHYTGAIHPVVFEQKNGSAFFGLAHTQRGLTIPFWDQYPHHFEIIGNVHGNPDLLGEAAEAWNRRAER